MMMAVVATALFVVTACDKKDGEDNGGTENNNTIVELTAPPYKDVAKVFNLTESNGTAIKQLASMTAFIPDMRVDKWLKSITNPMGTWKWAMKNIPSFNERWGMLNAGDEKLMPSDADYKMWNTDIMQWFTKVGLTPNKAVDAMTVAIGARSVYETRKSRYLSEGFEEEEVTTGTDDWEHCVCFLMGCLKSMYRKPQIICSERRLRIG